MALSGQDKVFRILVVEDESVVARDIQEQLCALGYAIAGHVTRGEDAVSLTLSNRPDLILMDIELDGSMDGIAAAHAIRNSTQCSVPIVFLTAFDADETLARAKLTEPFGYILKPFSERDLRTVVEMACYKFQAEARLRETNQYKQAILDNMVDGVITFDEGGWLRSCNQAARHIFGFADDEALGLSVEKLTTPNLSHHLTDFVREVRQRNNNRQKSFHLEITGLHKSGCSFPLDLTLTAITHAGQPSFIGLIRDLSQQHRAAEEIYQLAFYDRLTELPNRRLLLDHIQRVQQASARDCQHGALLLLDLDHFKRLNDSLGHAIGDELLRQVAKRLKTCMRESDQVARLGGDEFVVLIGGLSEHALEAATQAETTASKLLGDLGRPYLLDGHVHSNLPSIGLVVFQGQQYGAELLLQNAEIAMYQAKTGGRSTYRFFDTEMQLAAVERTGRVGDLQRALDHHEFALHYQIQVNRSNDPIGAEALVRWNHPTRGFVSPCEFISLAEETRMILPLGQWVLEQGCQQLALWSSMGVQSLWTLSINVSALQFSHPEFVDHVFQALKQSGANPRRLKLELTESMLVNNVEQVIAKMNALKGHGVQFSLDDFGTGYSSLSYLKRLPLDQLKIDQSFVRDLLNDPNDLVIAQAITALGHSLGLQVIAEGVETWSQRNLLAKIDCDAFQGYHFARPVAAEELLSTRLEHSGLVAPVSA